MVRLILSDIHANWQALAAVLECASGQYDEVLCCGDVVGYGADPNRVTEWVRNNVALTVRGNHDRFCSGSENMANVSPLAQAAAVWTASRLDPTNHAWLSALPEGPVDHEGIRVLHGSVRDEDEYIFDVGDVRQVAPLLGANILFFGHTHQQGVFYCHRNGIRQSGGPAANQSQTDFVVDDTASWLINPGSVGQPRDGDPRAAFALYDSRNRLLRLCRVAYDVAGAQKAIRKAGLPERLAARLAAGA